MKRKSKALHASLLPLSILAFFFMAASASAGELEERIKALEEVQRANAEELAQLKGEQMEFKKAATEAQEKLPTFEYAPTDGMTITAADKSWAFNVSYRLDIHMNNHFDSRAHFRGNDDGEFGEIASDVTSGELAPRRNRLTMAFCWEDCFYEFEYGIDGERAPRIAQVRENELSFHFEQWNPYLPLFSIGVRRGVGASHLGRSSSSDAKLEHHMLFGIGNFSGTGSHAGMGLHWNRVPVGTGDASLFLNYMTSSGGQHSDFVDTDRKGFRGFAGTRPFSKIKNKWIQGLELGVGLQYQPVDRFAGLGDGAIETHEERTAQTLFEFSDVGNGSSYIVVPGVKWRVGPYQLRANYLTARTEGRDDDFRGIWGKGFEVAHQIFLWSPKGFLTGSPSTPGSLLLGFAFERADAECGVPGCSEAHDTVTAGNSVSRITVLNREIGLWYWVRPGLRVGTWTHFWNASNTPVNTQVAIGCKSKIDSAEAGKGSGRDCDWWSWNLGLNYNW